MIDFQIVISSNFTYNPVKVMTGSISIQVKKNVLFFQMTFDCEKDVKLFPKIFNVQ